MAFTSNGGFYCTQAGKWLAQIVAQMQSVDLNQWQRPIGYHAAKVQYKYEAPRRNPFIWVERFRSVDSSECRPEGSQDAADVLATRATTMGPENHCQLETLEYEAEATGPPWTARHSKCE